MPSRPLISSADSVLNAVLHADRIAVQFERPARLNVPRPEKMLIGDPLCQAKIEADLPAADERVRRSPFEFSHLLSRAERQLVDRVRADDVRDVEHRPAGVQLGPEVVHERLEAVLRRARRVGVACSDSV